MSIFGIGVDVDTHTLPTLVLIMVMIVVTKKRRPTWYEAGHGFVVALLC